MKLTIKTRIYCMTAIFVLMLVHGVVIAAPQIERKVSVVVFPFAVSSEVAGDKADVVAGNANDLMQSMIDGLDAANRYSVVPFISRNPGIQRAVSERRLSNEEVTQAVDTTLAGKNRALKCADMIGSELAVIGSIDKYAFDEGKSQVELMATIQIIEAGTGKTVNTVTMTERSTGKQGESEQSISGVAVRSLGNKLVASISGPAPEKPAANNIGQVVLERDPKSSSNKSGWGWAALGALIIGIAAGGQ